MIQRLTMARRIATPFDEIVLGLARQLVEAGTTYLEAEDKIVVVLDVADADALISGAEDPETKDRIVAAVKQAMRRPLRAIPEGESA